MRHFQTGQLQRNEGKEDAAPAQGAFCMPGTEEFCIAGHMPGEEVEADVQAKPKEEKPVTENKPEKPTKAKKSKAGKTTS